MPNAPYVFLHDRLVAWDEAKVHVASVAFKFGTAVFEGIRGYWNEKQQQMYVFRLPEHLQRLAFSQRFMRFEEPFPSDYVHEQTLALLRANNMQENVHIMATVFVQGFGGPATCGPLGLSITAGSRADIPWVQSGCRVQVSAWQRIADTAMPARVKCNANYQNGRLAAVQAKVDGYDTAVLLNARGKVAEGPGMCFFMVRNGVAVTPSVNNDILESITRATVLELLPAQCGIAVEERDIDRSELAAADEAFFCGTAWEVTPINAIDGLALGEGKPGPVTRRLQEAYFRIAKGESDDYPKWRTAVYPTPLGEEK